MEAMDSKYLTLIDPAFVDAVCVPIGMVAIFRRRNVRRIEIGGFLLDAACLGIRKAWYDEFDGADLPEVTKRLFEDGYVEKDGPWGRKFVEGAVAYALGLGFKPPSDYKIAARVFGGINADRCQETFTYGFEGRPFYLQRQEDSLEKTRRISRQLQVSCGTDKFGISRRPEWISSPEEGSSEGEPSEEGRGV